MPRAKGSRSGLYDPTDSLQGTVRWGVRSPATYRQTSLTSMTRDTPFKTMTDSIHSENISQPEDPSSRVASHGRSDNVWSFGDYDPWDSQ